LCYRTPDATLRDTLDDHSDHSNLARATTKGNSIADVVSGSDLTEAQLNEMLELMPMDQRDVLLMDDYLLLPHLKRVALSLKPLSITDCVFRPRIMVPLATSTDAVFMAQYSLVYDCLDDGGNSQRFAHRFAAFSI
jgi:hypothetical protein